MGKRVLITGIHGQDSSYLADLLLSKGYEVYGMERRTSNSSHPNTKHLEGLVTFVKGDLTDQSSITRVVDSIKPQEVYNLGAQSFVGESWSTPEHTSNVTGMGALRVLEAIRTVDKSIKYYQAGSSEMFGKQVTPHAYENTPFYPRSPYGIAKMYAHWMTKNYRESYGMFCCNGILFNHESEKRGIEFVTRKITDGVARIKLGLADHITLGNLDAKRDWGYAPDYVEAMWLMMQHETPDDYVVATGAVYSIRDFIAMAFKCFGIDNWSSYVKTDPKYMRPTEVDYLCGDATKAKEVLGWEPKIDIQDWVCRMVNNDLNLLSNG